MMSNSSTEENPYFAFDKNAELTSAIKKLMVVFCKHFATKEDVRQLTDNFDEFSTSIESKFNLITDELKFIADNVACDEPTDVGKTKFASEINACKMALYGLGARSSNTAVTEDKYLRHIGRDDPTSHSYQEARRTLHFYADKVSGAKYKSNVKKIRTIDGGHKFWCEGDPAL